MAIDLLDPNLEPCEANFFGRLYIENGFENRSAYVAALAGDYGVDLDVVVALADLLGPSEDFDGLVSALQDLEE